MNAEHHAERLAAALRKCEAEIDKFLMCCSEQEIRESFNELNRARIEAAATLDGWKRRNAPEPIFMHTTLGNNPTSRGDFATLSTMLASNFDDAELCARLRAAELGECITAGGGAAPLFFIWRVR